MKYSSANILIVQINLDIFVQMMIELKANTIKTKRKCCVYENDMTNNKNERATFSQYIVSDGIHTLKFKSYILNNDSIYRI